MSNRSMLAAMAIAMAGTRIGAGRTIGPRPSEMPPKLIGPKYKPDKPKKNRALRRIKGR